MNNELTTTEKNVEQLDASATPSESWHDDSIYSPRFDCWESAEEIVMYGDLPGVMPEDLDIKFEDGQLLIHGRVQARHSDYEFRFGEYGLGDYKRSFHVGEMIDVDSISAELKNGVAIIRLPKSEHAKPRKIEVKSA